MLSVPALTVLLLAVAPASRPAESPADLKVMTFNIRYGTANDGDDRWERRRAQVFEVIRRHGPDLVGLQEALHFQIEEIRAAVPGHDLIGTGRDDGKQKGEYSAILYRSERLKPAESGTFWFSDTPEVPGSKHWGNHLPRICSWARFEDRRTGASFLMYNLHLDHQSQPSREKSAQALARRVMERTRGVPAIVTGDFNAGERNPAIRLLVARSSTKPAGEPPARALLRDSFRVIHPDEKVVGTFNGFKGTEDGDKIDYIFVTPDLDVLDAAILRDNQDGRYPSDHFPVVARLRLPSP